MKHLAIKLVYGTNWKQYLEAYKAGACCQKTHKTGLQKICVFSSKSWGYQICTSMNLGRLNRACFSMPNTEVTTENNGQAAATEAADGLSSCQGMIIHNFCREEFDNYYRTANDICSSFF